MKFKGKIVRLLVVFTLTLAIALPTVAMAIDAPHSYIWDIDNGAGTWNGKDMGQLWKVNDEAEWIVNITSSEERTIKASLWMVRYLWPDQKIFSEYPLTSKNGGKGIVELFQPSEDNSYYSVIENESTRGARGNHNIRYT